MPTIAADSRDWLTAFSAWPHAERARKASRTIRMHDPGPGGEHPVPAHDQVARHQRPRPERRRAQRERAEHDDGEVTQQDGDAEGHQDAVIALALGARIVEGRQQRPLQQDRQREGQRHRHQHGRQRRDVEQGDDEIAEIPAHHVDLAVREIDDLEDREDHGQSGGDQRVDHADDQPVQGLDEQVAGHRREAVRRAACTGSPPSPAPSATGWARRPPAASARCTG